MRHCRSRCGGCRSARGINGIEEAAKKFAGKHPDQMDAEEVASAWRQRVSSPYALSAERACSSSLIAWFNSGDRCMYLIVVLRLEAEGSFMSSVIVCAISRATL